MASLPRIALLLKIFSIPSIILILLLNNSSCEAKNILYAGETLPSDNFLSYGTNYMLIMQSDCNLVLYDAGNPLWASNTARTAKNCYCSLRVDGSLAIYDPSGSPIWSAGGDADYLSHGTADYMLLLQEDGSLVIYGGFFWAGAGGAAPAGNESSTVPMEGPPSSSKTPS
ncbi:hypothetical protein ACLOJK_012610 [Asimina triloba]